MRYQAYLLLAALCPLTDRMAHGACPSSSRQASSCLSGYLNLTDYSAGSARVPAMLEYCSNRADTEIRCIQKRYAACNRMQSSGHNVLYNDINYIGIQKAIGIMCKKTPHLSGEDKACVARHSNSVSACLNTRYKEQQSEITKLKSQAGTKHSSLLDEQLYHSVCQFVGEVYACQAPYQQFCGMDTHAIFAAITESLTPLVCDTNPGVGETPRVGARRGGGGKGKGKGGKGMAGGGSSGNRGSGGSKGRSSSGPICSPLVIMSLFNIAVLAGHVWVSH